jgi:nucleotide-binding universal stress UspA family protein
MQVTKPEAKIHHILCPTDLSDRSQKALGVASRLADTMHASLTACHCAAANWFTYDNRLPQENLADIKRKIRDQLVASQDPKSGLTWRAMVIENSFDPARDIVRTAVETSADLIVMKARPGVLSAIHFGSLVERVIQGAPCPVLLLPSKYLDRGNASETALEFHRILFDYDFSEATDRLAPVVNALTEGYHAELRVLSVLEPSGLRRTEAAPVPFSRTRVQTIVRGRLKDVLEADGIRGASAAVEWGRHADTVLEYAKSHKVDLICTALAPPHFYFEKLYRGYLGSLLRSAECPILVTQAAPQTGQQTL